MDGVKEEVIEGDCTPWIDNDGVVKHEPAWSMDEDSPDQPSSVYNTVQPMSDNISGSLLSLKRGRVCQHCSAAFVLISSLELHLASIHGEPLPILVWNETGDGQMSLPHGRLSTEETGHVRKYSADSAIDFVVKMEPAWSMEEDSPDQPSADYSTAQPMSENTSGTLLSLNSKYQCYLCSTAFVLFSSLELHLVSVHGEKLHMVLPGSSTPDRCNAGNCSNTDIHKEVYSYSNRKMSVKKKAHDDDTSDKDGKNKNKKHMCDVCRKSFPKPSKLKIHKMTHSGVKPFVCDVCSKSFTQAFKLNKHKLTHSGHQAFVCDMCNKSFTLAENLTRHKKVHTEERRYKCPHCDSGFKESRNLQRHIKSVHEGVRPHVCDVCGAAFSTMGNLTVHKRIHTGEKPHECSDCGKGFVNSSALKIHQVTHTGQKKHRCPHCPAAFKFSTQLKRHVLKEHL